MLEFVNFEYLLKDIIRGVQVKAEELNKLKTNLNTGYYYLMLSHITKGVLDLDNNPQYLRNIPKNYDKYCIEDECLLISKIGLPLKTVVVDSLGAKKVLATGNVYIAKIDTSKINIYYLQAFLQSEQGLDSLKKIAKGENIKNISLKQLMTLKIPVPTLEKQEMIANEYKQLLNEIKDLKKKIRVVENSFSSLWLSGIESE